MPSAPKINRDDSVQKASNHPYFLLSELYLNLFTLRGGIDDSRNDSLVDNDLRDRNGSLSAGLYRVEEGSDLLLPEISCSGYRAFGYRWLINITKNRLLSGSVFLRK